VSRVLVLRAVSAGYLVRLRCELDQRLIERLDEAVDMFGFRDQRWPKLQDVAEASVFADQRTVLSEELNEELRLIRRRGFGVAACDQLKSDEEATAAYVSDDFVTFGQLPEFCSQILARGS